MQNTKKPTENLYNKKKWISVCLFFLYIFLYCRITLHYLLQYEQFYFKQFSLACEHRFNVKNSSISNNSFEHKYTV